MQIEVSQIPHRYRNRFLRDNSGSVTVNKNSTSNSASNSFYPVNIWGQYFDDTEDINGDFNTRGSVYAENSLNASTLNISNDSSLHYVCTENIEPRQNNLYSLGSAAKQWKDLFVEDGNFHNLTVTGSAHFFELIIDKLKSVGGTVILSAANATIDKVESVSGGYKLWWRKEDNDRAKAIMNEFAVNDQVICQSFNAQTGISHNVSNKYYWRLVTAVGDGSTTIDGQTKDCNYIIVSDSVKDGSSVPEVGDEIMQLGYRGTDDDERQSAIILSAYKSPDLAIKAPSIAQYVGINDFNLSNHKYTWFAANGNNIRGNLKVTSGTTVEDLITQMSVDEDAIIARINSSLGPTGIDIVNQKITLTAANTVINGNLNLYDSNNSGFTIYDADNVPRVNIQSDVIDSISAIANDSYNYYNLSNSGTASSWDLTTAQQSFVMSKYDTLDVDKFNVIFSAQGSVYPTAYVTTLAVIIEKPNGSTVTHTLSTFKQDNFGRYSNTDEKIRFAAESNGTYKVSVRAQNSTSMSGSNTLYLNVNMRMQTAANAQTYIGRDGFYSHAGANKLLWSGESELQLRYGFNGIRWSNADAFGNKSMDVACQIKGTAPNYKPVWLPFYNYTPTFSVGSGTSPYLFTSQTVGNISETKYAFVVNPYRDRGICIVTSGYIDSSFNECESWIVLPPTRFTDADGETASLPTGYTITVINWTQTNIYVVPYSNSNHGAVIVDANRNNNYYADLNGVQSRDTYIYVGNWAGLGDTWLSMHDTQ